MVEVLALGNLALRPKEIWLQVSNEMNRRSVNWNGLTDRQVIKLVGNVCTKQNGGDIFRALESPHMAMVKDSQLFFCSLTLLFLIRVQAN